MHLGHINGAGAINIQLPACQATPFFPLSLEQGVKDAPQRGLGWRAQLLTAPGAELLCVRGRPVVVWLWCLGCVIRPGTGSPRSVSVAGIFCPCCGPGAGGQT